MYAIIDIAGKQFRVRKNDKIKVPLLKAEAGKKIEFDHVLYFEDENGKPQIGQPLLKEMKISATVVEHGRDKKIIVFKKKRRKGYQVKNGHRQGFSIVKIDDIEKAKPVKKTAPKKEEKKAEPTKTAPKEEKTQKSAPKKDTVKKTAPKKDDKKAAPPKKATATKAKKSTVKKVTDKPAKEKEA